MKILLLTLLVLLNLEAKYQSSKSCAECHEEIYNEHASSMHHRSTIMGDEVHKKLYEAGGSSKYECALCHMPSSPNLASLMRGDLKAEDADYTNPANSDGVSCFYCHQINKIHRSTSSNINFTNIKEGQKPIFLGTLKNAMGSDVHESEYSELFASSGVCMGCHSHKQNDFGIELCNSLDQHGEASNCIECHMPKKSGLVEKYNKGARSKHASHEFLGVRSSELVKKAVSLDLSYDGDLTLSIENKMAHSIITQPMRLKFVKTTITRGTEVIWSNFQESPLEDKEATFLIVFQDDEGNVSLPNSAKAYKINQNLRSNTTKKVIYKDLALKSGDIVTSKWISYTVNPNIAKKLGISDESVTKPIVGAETSIVIE
ncbi:MAG: multiheme c-type cytochrome [Sulfuricurvum sp.]